MIRIFQELMSLRSLGRSRAILKIVMMLPISLGMLFSAGCIQGQNMPDEHAKLMTDMRSSIYKIEKGKVATTVKSEELLPAQRKQLALISSVFGHIHSQVAVPEGARIVVRTLDSKRYEVIFSNGLPDGRRGADYAAKATVNESGEILAMLVGS